jgi:hypothetical protein
MYRCSVLHLYTAADIREYAGAPDQLSGLVFMYRCSVLHLYAAADIRGYAGASGQLSGFAAL